MTPLTRKENYLNEIVGWGNTAPEKPLTPEELFFAAILGEAVQVPDLSNASRYELFLAKIAGYNVNVSPPTYTSPRLEFFLAKAAGMDVVTPVPLTKEEIFWANYKGREQIIEGVPPLMFTAKASTLSNYRIYGNTVGGESVGDKTNNVLQNTAVSQIRNDAIFTVNNDKSVTISGTATNEYIVLSNASGTSSTDDYTVPILKSGENLIFTTNSNLALRARYTDGTYKGSIASGIVFTVPKDIGVVYIQLANEDLTEPITVYPMVRNADITNDVYEPYGYRVPITVNSNTTNIYLDEQLVKSGDDADYIDYATQKRYNADGTSQSVELPTLQTVEGTNTLSVEITVQPSKVMVKIGEASAYKVRYYVDDTMARVETVSGGTNAQGFTPTKASTARYNYTFMGWSTTKGSTTAETGVLNDITADKSLYAVFSQSLRTFTVYFYNGSTLLQTAENVQYGGTATYTGETPTKDGFTFSGWQPSNVNITADTSCYAQFAEG